MNWKEFFKPEWKKFIIPIILITILAIFISWFSAVLKPIDKYGCQLFELSDKIMDYREQNDTLNMNETINDLESLQDQFKKEMESSAFLFKDIDNVKGIFNFIFKTDPLFPVPCSFSPEKNCRYYISEKTVECLNKKIQSEYVFSNLIGASTPPYRKLSFFDISINILILFIEGYFLSCLIIWIYNKAKKK